MSEGVSWWINRCDSELQDVLDVLVFIICYLFFVPAEVATIAGPQPHRWCERVLIDGLIGVIVHYRMCWMY